MSDARDVMATVAARLRPLGSESSRRTPDGEIPCFIRVTPVNVVYASLASVVATSFCGPGSVFYATDRIHGNGMQHGRGCTPMYHPLEWSCLLRSTRSRDARTRNAAHGSQPTIRASESQGRREVLTTHRLETEGESTYRFAEVIFGLCILELVLWWAVEYADGLRT